VRRKQAAGLVAIAIIVIALTFIGFGRDKNASGKYITAPVERVTISRSVSANGTLEALRTVQVGSQISGQLAAIHADYNSTVKKGQLLAEIDPRTFRTQVATEQAQVASAAARLKGAEADIVNQQAGIAEAEANLEAARVAAENASLQFDRAKQLNQQGLVSKNDYDIARTNAETANAKVSQAQAALEQAKAAIRTKDAQVQQVRADISGARANLDRAAVNLEMTKIYSPVDGVVISRNVDVGQTVAASLQAPTLFVIANDLTQMQVKASVDEADIGKISQHAGVTFTVDAYPDEVFKGTINQIRLEPQTVQNVVTYNVMVAVANPDLKLKPGMTANLNIMVDEHPDVLTIPNAALRFKPEGTNATPPRVRGKATVVWVPGAADKPRPVPVQVGLSDGSRTEIVGGDLREGDRVIIGAPGTSNSKPPSGAPPVGLPFGGMRGAGGGAGRRGGN
jgi:HlyD family secretion protein